MRDGLFFYFSTVCICRCGSVEACSRCGVGGGGFDSHRCMLAVRFQFVVVTFPFCAFRDRCDCPLQVLIPEVIFGVRESCCDSHVQVVIEISLFFWGPGKNVKRTGKGGKRAEKRGKRGEMRGKGREKRGKEGKRGGKRGEKGEKEGKRGVHRCESRFELAVVALHR